MVATSNTAATIQGAPLGLATAHASALGRLGVLIDEYAITVNLAPADLRMSGAALGRLQSGAQEVAGGMPRRTGIHTRDFPLGAGSARRAAL